MKFAFFIVRKIAFSSRRTFSRFIIAIAIAAIALSIAVMIITSSLLSGFQQTIKGKIFGFWANVQVAPYSNEMGGYTEKALYKNQNFYTNPSIVKSIDHIQAVALKGAILRTRDQFEGVVLKGAGPDYDWNRFRPFLKAGNILTSDDSSNVKQIVLSTSTAARMQLDTGSTVIVSFIGDRVRMKKFRIVGLYSTGIEEFDKQYALCNLSFIQNMNGWTTDSVGAFEIFVKDVSQSEAAAEEVYNVIEDPYLEVSTIEEVQQSIFDWLKLQQTNEYVILVIMSIVAVINMITALLILILERTNMVGILKALGSTNAQLIQIFMQQAALIIFAGMLAGNVTGFAICLLQKYFALIKLDEASYYVSVAPISFDWPWLVAINAATFIVCLGAMLLPCLLVLRIQAVKAIQFK